MRDRRVWFVVVLYKPDKKVLRRLLRALAGFPVVVVDNSKQNLGYGGGANVGIRRALKKGAQWVVVLNQDLSMSPSAAGTLVKKLKETQAGIAGPMAGGLDPRRWTSVLPAKETDYITGSCIAIHREVVERIGYFYEPYFLYYEETDFCLRARSAGFPLLYIPTKGITHMESVSLGRGSFLHQYYLARNHLLFVERCAPLRVRLYEFFRLPKTLWDHWRKGEKGALRGVRNYLNRRFGAQRQFS